MNEVEPLSPNRFVGVTAVYAGDEEESFSPNLFVDVEAVDEEAAASNEAPELVLFS